MFKTKTNLSYFVSFAKSDWSRNVDSSLKLPAQDLLLSLRGEPEFFSLYPGSCKTMSTAAHTCQVVLPI